MHPKLVAILDAPTNLGLKPPAEGREPGVRRMPDVLRSFGIVERLGAEDAGRVPAPPYVPRRDPATRMRNAPAIASYSLALADTVGPLVARGRFPLVLGGDCSILLGSLLALRERGRFGLLFLDGHHDLLTPETSASGGAAGMDLALALGHGPGLLTDLRGQRPLVHGDDLLFFGYRDKDEYYPAEIVAEVQATAFCRSLAEARHQGLTAALQEGLDRLRTNGVEGLWIHLDADVLDNEIMPAVDSPQPDGLTWSELHEVLTTVLGSGLVTGLQITIYDPDLDPDLSLGKSLAEALVTALG